MGRIGWCEGGAADVTHAQLTAWIPTGGGGTCRYLSVQDPSRQRAPCPPALLRGSGQGQFSGPLKARGRRRVGTCLAPSCIVEVPSGGSDGDLSCPSCLARPNSAVPVRCYCHGRNAMLLGKFCHTRDEPGQAESASACSRYAAASLFHTAVEAQLAGWAAKSIQPSMIHQIGVGICPERLDPAVAGLATRGRHSRVEALRLETCCANHEPSTPVQVKVLPCTCRLPGGPSWTASTHYLETLHVQAMCCYQPARLPDCQNCQSLSSTFGAPVRSWYRGSGGRIGIEIRVQKASADCLSSCFCRQHEIPRGTPARGPAPSLALAYRPLALLSTLRPACLCEPSLLSESAGRCEAAVAAPPHWGHPCQILISAAVNDPQPTPPPT